MAKGAVRGLKRGLRAALIGVLSLFAPWARSRQGHRPLVLAYHDPSPETFERHLSALSRRYAIVPLADVLNAHSAGAFDTLPLRPLVITIDDGHARNRELLPVLRRHGVRPTVFACTRVAEGFWWSGIDGPEQRRLKLLPDSKRRQQITARGPVRPEALERALEPDEIIKMADEIEFEPHTRTHPVLPHCNDETATYEIEGSKRDLEGLLGRVCHVFAYPNGDYGLRDTRVVARSGFRWALTTRPDLIETTDDPLHLPRVVVRDDAPVTELLVRASGLTGMVQRFVPARIWSAMQIR